MANLSDCRFNTFLSFQLVFSTRTEIFSARSVKFYRCVINSVINKATNEYAPIDTYFHNSDPDTSDVESDFECTMYKEIEKIINQSLKDQLLREFKMLIDKQHTTEFVLRETLRDIARKGAEYRVKFYRAKDELNHCVQQMQGAEQKVQEPQTTVQMGEYKINNLEDADKCIVCFGNEINTFYTTCLHMYTCYDCCSKIGNRCSVC